VTIRADLIVVGAGLAGSAAAHAAAKRGLSVVVLEAFGPGHRKGSSQGSARIFRRAYPDPLYVRLTGRAGELWRELEAEAGERLLTRTGGIDFGPVREPARLHELLTAHCVSAELLPEQAAAERWPGFDFAGAGPVVFHPDAGVLDPDTAITAMLGLATARGADVRFHSLVTRLEAGGDGAIARTDNDTFTAPVAVVAAGAWLAPLLDGLVALPPLTVTQQQVFHFAQAQAGLARLAGEPWPVFVFQDETDFCYGLPGGMDGEVPGTIKIGEHDPGKPTTASGRDYRVDVASRDQVIDFACRRLPGLDPQPVNESTSLYTWTTNEDFILDRPAGGPFVIASPCSGHGATFAPLVGEILADLVAGKPSPEPRFTLPAHRAYAG
jgi:monomeric sarcosine oxidase